VEPVDAVDAVDEMDGMDGDTWAKVSTPVHAGLRGHPRQGTTLRNF